MNDVLYFNGRFTTTDERVLKVEDRGFLFGDAIYEVFKFVGRRPVFLPEHWRRLMRSLDAIEIPNPWDERSFRDMTNELLARTAFDTGIVYVEVSRGEGERSHFWTEGMKPTAIAFTRRVTFPDAARKATGIRLATSPDRRWKRCDVKSVNLLPNVMAKTKAHRAAADEALLIDGGIVRECASSNFFIVSGGRIVTHPLDEHILPGVTRARTIALAGGEVDERPILVEEIATADEIFISSTSFGVMPVRQIDDGPERTPGPVSLKLQKALDEAEVRSARELVMSP